VRAALALAAMLAAGCETVPEPPNGAPPEGAVEIAPDLYMVPVGEDETGCPMYTPWSRERMVQTLIHYPRADGSFTPLREEADACDPPDG
jgi:hypothetical protein